MKQKLVVLSMDAMVGEDLEYLKTKPNYQKLMAHCAGSKVAQTLYPSITYPAHVSIMTGCPAGKHGIIDNVTFHPGYVGPAEWHLYRNEVKVSTIFDAAKKQGLSTASIYWPVTGNDPNIDYLINEYFFYDPAESATPEKILEGYARFGANEETLKAVRENMDRFPVNYKNRHGKITLDQTFDHFINGCMCSMIRNIKPDLLLAHNCILDTIRHKNGIFNEYVTEALDITDMWLGELIQAMQDAGTYEDTNFVILSDHGQMNFARRLKVNVLLNRGGFLTVAEDGSLKNWKAFSLSNGMSATVHVKEKKDEKAVYDYLNDLLSKGVYGFSKIYTREEVSEKYGLDGDFSFVLETDGFTTFSDGWTEPVLNAVDFSDYRLGKATHGYEPEKGPQPVFVCTGPSFKKDVMVPFCKTIDEAPTLARTFGGEMPEAVGKVIEDILK